ncbi:organic hydroperoxide resistance protein [Actinospica robiniae]|uniref:organic hydroperoxide resistance protein n=1 Tax=Actinospica robiniae TaxID=304901 RepID=UPI000413E458|nr:organic hydroperoxide resistance protein [Actinospica robiniae]
MSALYTSEATATNGREGRVSSPDGQIDLALAFPVEAGGTGKGTNPEQLFAAGYSACFGSALDASARQAKVNIRGTTVTGEVTLNKDDDGFAISVVLRVALPEAVSKEEGRKLVEAAHQVCPYSKATRGNIDVEFVVE